MCIRDRHDPEDIPQALLSDPQGFAPLPRHALDIHGHPSAKIFDRAFLLWALPELPAGALATTHLLARVCSLAERIVRLESPAQIATAPGTRQIWEDPQPAAELAEALRQMQADRCLVLPEGWEARIWARLVWEKLNHAGYGDAEQAFAAEVRRLSAPLRQVGAAGLDGFVGPRVRRMIGLPESSAVSPVSATVLHRR